MLREPILESIGDPLAVCLLPVLMHRMNNATQLLSNLHGIQQQCPERDWLRDRAPELGESSESIQRIGYLLAVLSSACGADLLLARRELHGLQYMVDAVTDVVRREGGELSAHPGSLPNLSPSVHQGWELPWAFGALLHDAAFSSESSAAVEWQLLHDQTGWVLISSCIPADRFVRLGPLVEERLPESILEVCAEGWSWRLPEAWLLEQNGGRCES
ncbi:MAG: hypothetical protein ACI9F9_003448 [Candidatus Paceibacteria bacterium]|jgi:hypothetical protein